MNAPRMQRRHFQCVAQGLWRSRPLPRDGEEAMRQWSHTVSLVADSLSATNLAFRRETFLAACGAQS